MRRFFLMILGFALAFASAITAIFAVLLLGVGVAGGYLLRSRPDTSRIINYDPSTVIAKSPFVALIAFAFALMFAIIAVRLRRAEKVRFEVPGQPA
ncbi:MAG: hypothetical protein ACR2OO_16395 [Thermomicrobiales bacterium]